MEDITEEERDDKLEESAPRYERQITPKEYLDWERNQEYKHEYFEGRIVRLQGASRAHALILSNLIIGIGNAIKGKPCEVYPNNLRVFVKARESYFYPDATIVCGNAETTDEMDDNLVNPQIIFEILSPSTKNFDLGKKFFFYMQLESLQEYVTIDSSIADIQVRRKSSDNSWAIEQKRSDVQVAIETAGIVLKTADIYRAVKFAINKP